uniref:Ig-like domain-containing protein n=1 Tax=Cyprinus carpio TaxID=7962 RepID=A0A8C1U6D0_CYPCA
MYFCKKMLKYLLLLLLLLLYFLLHIVAIYYLQSTHISSVSVEDVILESPVHSVTEGDSLTLRCLYEHSTPPILSADFYKDGSLIQSQTTEMIISTVSKSHEGFYYCKHPKRGESPKSWISVRASSRSSRSDGLTVAVATPCHPGRSAPANKMIQMTHYLAHAVLSIVLTALQTTGLS